MAKLVVRGVVVTLAGSVELVTEDFCLNTCSPSFEAGSVLTSVSKMTGPQLLCFRERGVVQ